MEGTHAQASLLKPSHQSKREQEVRHWTVTRDTLDAYQIPDWDSLFLAHAPLGVAPPGMTWNQHNLQQQKYTDTGSIKVSRQLTTYQSTKSTLSLRLFHCHLLLIYCCGDMAAHGLDTGHTTELGDVYF